MITTAKRCDARRFFARALVVAAVALTTFFLSTQPMHAQEVVDPRSGQLQLAVTDLVLPAGAINLELSRTLGAEPGGRGLLGTRWRLNWESRLIQAKPQLLVVEGQRIVAFSPAGDQPGYVSGSGERLIIGKDGRAVRTRPDGSRETFDAQGRLAERDERNGNKIILRYGSDGRLSRIEGPKGSFIQFKADSQGRVVGVETSTSATVRYAYVNDQLAEVQVNGGPPTRYAYDAGGALTRIEDPQSGAVELAYDANGRVLTRRWADGSQERFEYDDAANRQRHIDPAGGVSTTQWSEDRRQVEITDPLGHRSVIVYDSSGRPLSVTGPIGAASRLAYDALGRPVVIENPAGQVTRFEYLGVSVRLKTITRPDGTQASYEYDGQGNLTAVKLGSETTTALSYYPDGGLATTKGHGSPEQRFTYHPDGRLKSITNPLNAATSFEYDRRGNLVQETNPLGGATRYQYDAQDRLLSVTDPVGGITRYEYDPQGRLSRIIGPDGAETRYTYDARGRLTAETDSAGQVARYEYDAAGRLVNSIGPGSAVDRVAYDPGGRLVEWSDRLGRTTRYEYDALGRMVVQRRASGREVRYRYDGLGNLVGLADVSGMKVEFQRDVYGRITATVDPLGAITRYLYDPLGNLISLTDPRGQVKQFVYGADGGLTRAQESSGDTAQYEYDRAARLVAIHRPSGGVARITYDAMGNVVAEEDPLGNRRRHTYDLASRRISTTDAMGRVSRYTYDPAGRLTRKQLPDGTQVTYQYDLLGNLIFADDGVFPVKSSFDLAGRILRVEYPAIKKTVTYEYDALGLRSKLIYPDGSEVRYEYDGQKRLAAIVLAEGKRVSLTYDVQDRLQAVGYPNGITGRWEYEAANRLASIHYQDRAGQPVAGWIYRYDPAGNPVQQQDHQGRATQYQFDPADQLAEEAGPDGAIRYRYASGGNRDSVEDSGTVVHYRHDAADRVVQAGPEQLAYDADGNMIARKGSDGTTAYEYDAAGRLVKVTGSDGTITTFGYAPTGERVWKRDRDGLTYYLYDGFDLIQELAENGTPKATYVHGTGIDRPLAMWRDGQRYYYHADRLGSIRVLTDDRGQVAASYDYDVFARLTERHVSVTNPFTFTGREFDKGIGLYYYRTRYYDAQLGRFLSKDAVSPLREDPLALNPYLYARNNPVRFVDPLGLDLMDDTLELYNLQRALKGLDPLSPQAGGIKAQIRALESKIANAVPAARAAAAATPGASAEISPQGAQVNGPRGSPYGRPPVYENVPNKDLPARLPGHPEWETGTGKPTLSGPAEPTPPNTTPTLRIRRPPLQSQSSPLPAGPEPRPPGPPKPGYRWVGVLQGAVWVWILVKVAMSDDPAATAEGMVPGMLVTQVAATCGTICGGPGGGLIAGAVAGVVFNPPGSEGRVPDVKPAPAPPPPPPSGARAGFDPTRDPGMPTGTRDQTVRAGQETGPSKGGTLTGQQPNQGKGEGAQQPGTYTEKPGGAQTAKGSEGSVPPYWGYPPAGVDQAQTPGRVTVDSLTPGSKGSRDRSLAPPKGSTTGGGPSSGGTSPAAPATVPGVTAQKPPAQTPPPAAGGKPCDPPLCRELCSFSGGSACTTPPCSPQVIRDHSTCVGNNCSLDSGKVYQACYKNMLARCIQGQAGGTGGWCVGPGADKTCEARAKRVCGLRSSLLERGPTLYARFYFGDPVIPSCGGAVPDRFSPPVMDLRPFVSSADLTYLSRSIVGPLSEGECAQKAQEREQKKSGSTGKGGLGELNGDDGSWHAAAQPAAPLAGLLLPALLSSECRTPN